MIDLSENSRWWERFALLAIIIALLWMGPANIWDKQVDHGYPYGFYAQDTFIFMSYQPYLEESGNWAHLAPYLSRGFTDVVQSQPSALEILSVLLAQATGFGYYTTTYLIVMILVMLAVLCFYFLIRTFNPKVALLSLPLNVLLFSQVFMSAFTWGNWPFFAGSCMFVLFFWCLGRIKERWIPALGALAMSAVAFGHTSEYIFIIPILGFMFLVDIASRQFNWAEWKRIAGMCIASAILAGYYLIIFFSTFFHGYERQYLTPESTGLSLFVSVTTPGTWLLLVMAAALLVGLMMLKKHRSLQIGIVLFLIGFTNYLGTGKRGLETRYMWPIYLSVFFGILLYFAITNIAKQKLALRTCAIISIILTAFLANQYYTEMGGPGILFKEGWQAMEWIAKETPKNSTVFYFYADGPSSQSALLFNTQRISDLLVTDEFISMARIGQLKRNIQAESLFDHTNSLPYRKGLFSFGFRWEENNVQARSQKDLCSYDYYEFDKVSRIPGAGEYNRVVADHFVTKANFTKAYENDGVLILKNPRPGGDCIVNATTA
jgi:hypothetical protein